MKISKLSDMKGGWFIGDFQPNVFHTQDFEAACKHYDPGDDEPRHVHKIATEITLIVSGTVRMNGKVLTAGDIIVLSPGESSDFSAIDEAMVLAIKVPSVIGDKYLVDE